MKTIENLEQGEMLLVSARKVNGGKVQLTFAQKIKNPNVRPQSIVGALNASDDRFSQSGGPRYAWIAVEPKDASEALGLDFSSLKEVGDEMDINKLNPTLNGESLSIQITETTDGTDYEVSNYEDRAKKAGPQGDFILTDKGEYIYVHSTVIAGEADHFFYTNTVRSSQYASSQSASEDAIADALEG